MDWKTTTQAMVVKGGLHALCRFVEQTEAEWAIADLTEKLSSAKAEIEDSKRVVFDDHKEKVMMLGQISAKDAEIARLRKAIVWCVMNAAEFTEWAGLPEIEWAGVERVNTTPCDGTHEQIVATVCRLAGGE